ncbi:MAG: DNA topoisomerase IV subunit A [Candidatus Latescibacterota bacterium]|nr:DNA topoisomerase IV subunit A [Candidatus Latescibacterota bacterium]
MAYVDKLYNDYFLEYASYYIKERAIPYLEDGLKPVQRRILHSLHELDDGKFHKVANVVGNTMKYHPHGDASINNALVVLANKDLLIEKQGNFGNIFTGDDAAAGRYIECRLTKIAHEVLFNKELTEYIDSYDGRNQEPIVLPAKIPILLTQGAEGIAVGMSTRILPHNLTELLNAEIAYLRDKTTQLYPDFPTGGKIDVSDYQDGNGKVLVRAQIDTADSKRIIIRQIPYGTTTESLIASIEDAVRKNKVKVAAIQDYTAEQVEIELKLARGVYSEDVVETLYAFTECEVSISTQLMLIEDNKPRVLSVTEVLQQNVDQLIDILTAELRLEKKKLKERLHARTLEQLFIENRVYKVIEEQTTNENIHTAVHKGLAPFSDEIGRDVTEEDIETLLKIPIRRISRYDIQRAQKEMREIRKRLREINRHLKEIIPYAINFLEGIVDRYGAQFERRTEIESFSKVDVRQAAKRDLKLRYDAKTGYLGYTVNGENLFEISNYDRILVIRKDGTYSVIDVPDKLFVDRGMLHCGFIDEEQIYNLVYKDKKGLAYIKRCNIQKFILNKVYKLNPEGTKLLKFTANSEKKIVLDYKPKPRLKILNEEFLIRDYPIRGIKAGGIRLASRELQTCKIT